MYIKNQVSDDLINLIVNEFLPKYISKTEIEAILSIKVELKKVVVYFEDYYLEAYFDHPLGFENPLMRTVHTKVLTPINQETQKSQSKSERSTKIKSRKIVGEAWKEILKKCTTNEVPWKLGLRTLIEDNGFKIVAQRTDEFYYFFLINPEISKGQTAQIEINLNVVKQIFSGLNDNELAKELVTRAPMSLEHELLKNYIQIPEKIKKEKVVKPTESTLESPSESEVKVVGDTNPEVIEK